MARRTYNRSPFDMSMNYYEKQGLRDSCFNINEFKGICSNKNYVGIDQQTFVDANNVYVNQDDELATRPPIVEHRPEYTRSGQVFHYIPENETVITMRKINNITFFHTFDGTDYHLRWAYNNQGYAEPVYSRIKIMWWDAWYLIFTDSGEGSFVELKAVKYNYSLSNSNGEGTGDFERYTVNNILYRPEFVSGGQVEIDIKEQNVFTDEYTVTFPLEFGESIPTEQLTGKNVSVKIGNDTFVLEPYVSNNDKVFTTAFSSPQLNTNWAEISICNADNKFTYFVDDGSKLRYSPDGNMFTTIPMPVAPNGRWYEWKCKIARKALVLYFFGKYITSSNDFAFRVCKVSLENYQNIQANSWISYDVSMPTSNPFNYATGDSQSSNDGVNLNITGYNTTSSSMAGAFTNSVIAPMTDYTDAIFDIDSETGNECLLLYQARANLKVIGCYGRCIPLILPANRRENSNYQRDVVCVGVFNGNTRVNSYALFNLSPNTFNRNYIHRIKAYTYSSMCIAMLSGHYGNTRVYNCLMQFTTSSGTFGIPRYRIWRYAPVPATQYGTYSGTVYLPIKDYLFFVDSFGKVVQDAHYPFNASVFAYRNMDADLDIRANGNNVELEITFAYTNPFYSSNPLGNSKDIRIKNQWTIQSTWSDMVYADDYMYAKPVGTIARHAFPIAIVSTVSVNVRTIMADNTRGNNTFAVSYNGTVLSEDYLFWQDSKINLLKREGTLTALYVNDTGIILYKNGASLYTSQYTGKVYASVITQGFINTFMPDTTCNAFRNLLSKNNKLYVATKEVDTKGQVYVQNQNVYEFEGDITEMSILSTTSVAIFLESQVYVLYENEGLLYLTRSKLQLGNKRGSDVLESYDGSSVFVTNLKGLTSLNYQDFVQSTEQIYTYLSENIMDDYDEYAVSPIKLFQYKDWIIMYRQDTNYFYLYDLRKNSWWKWTLPYPIQNLSFDDSLLLLLNGRIFTFDFSYNIYKDYGDQFIDWKIVTQRLHFNSPNNYKHVRSVNVITGQPTKHIRYKLVYRNYRDINNTSENEVKEYLIGNLTTAIARVAFIKTNAFQLELSADKTDELPVQFITPNISIKYRVTERIR